MLKNMGRVHRLAYAAVGVAALCYAVTIGSGLPFRAAIAVVGVAALFSSLSGYCSTCHVLGLTTKNGRVERLPGQRFP